MCYYPHRRKHHSAAGGYSLPDPQHYWAMSSTGNETDLGVNGDTDALDETGTVGSVTGINGNARDFDGGANQLKANGGTGAHVYTMTSGASNTWSVAMSVKFDTLASAQYIWGTEWARLEATSSNAKWADASSVTHTKSLSTGTWYHFAFGYDAAGDVMWLTIDDEAPSTTSGVTSIAANGTGWILSMHANRLNGQIDEVPVFDSDIRGAELTELYNAGSPPTFNGTIWV